MVERILADYDEAYRIRSIALCYFNAARSDPEGKIGEDHRPEVHLIPSVLDAVVGMRSDIKVFGIDYLTRDRNCI